jgi:hypothetical protein
MKRLLFLLFFAPAIIFAQSDNENSKTSKDYKQEKNVDLKETPPSYPGCDRRDFKFKMKCTSDKIAKFVNKNFDTDIAGRLGLIGMQTIKVAFKIDKNGDITAVRSRAQHPALEKEAIRVIKLLPKMNPGYQKGVPVIVPYSLPIYFVARK